MKLYKGVNFEMLIVLGPPFRSPSNGKVFFS